MKALVTGATGFVGRHMVAALRERGDDVTTVDIAGQPAVDVRDFCRADDTRYDLVVHLAAVVGGRQMIEGQPLGVAVNLALDAEVFAWAARTRPGRLVYFSSSAAYPVALQSGTAHRLRETDIDLTGGALGMPDQTYGWAKLSGELLAAHARAAGLRVTVLRPFSGYGSDQAPSYPFRAFIDRARGKEDPYAVWGNGSQVRDWIHVSDVVSAALAAAEQDHPGPLNVCTGRPTTFTELAALVTAAAGYTPAVRYVPTAPSGVRYRVGDPTELHRVYTPRVPLEDGIARALDA